MSNKQDTNKSNNTEPKFDENRAYEELRMIFVIAIETQDFSTIETRIAAWEKKYPLAEFTDPEIIRKIKAILNKDFLSRLLGDYLSAQILHEQEKQKEAYDSLKTIIDNAKKSKDYKTAQKEIRKWKNTLNENGFTLYSFNRLYRARVCTLLLLPSKELKNQEQATDELNKLKEDGKSMDSKSLFEAISKWQNTYSIPDFPDKLQKDLNKITTEVFDSISQKRTSESAISEIEKVLASKGIPSPANAIASILSKYDYSHFDANTTARIRTLSMEALYIQEGILNEGIPNIDPSVLPTISPVEAQALTSLRDILNKTPHNMDTILNWIYVNRKINYSEFARETILKQFSTVGYIIPKQSSYAIPETNPNLDYKDFSKVNDLRKSVILNYLGIISQGNKLSIEGKDNLNDAHTVSSEESINKKDLKPIMFLKAFDTVIEKSEIEGKNVYDETGSFDISKEEELIYNVFIEDIIDDPLATYSISTASINEKTKSTDDLAQAFDNKKPANKSQSSSSKLDEIEISNSTSEKTNSSCSDADSGYSLTIEDNKNLEQAYELSTYVVIASPILEQALTQKVERSRKKGKDIERIKD